MEEQSDLLKEYKIQLKKLQRENRRLEREAEVLKSLNEQVSRTQQFFHQENQRQLCYNHQILKTSPYILVMVNEKLETVMASDVFFHMSDVSRDAVKEGMKLGEAFRNILGERELQTFLERCGSVLDSQGTDTFLLTTRMGESERIYQADICYYLAQNEDAKGLSIILSDMTEIVEAKEKAIAAGKAKSRFLAQMSHEIRTPINAVLGMNEMILRECKDPSILEYSSNIQNAGRTLLSLINSILDFSKIEEGKMEIIPVEYDTASVMNNLVASISERARQKGLELQVELDRQLPAALFGDDVRVSQVIMNLLTNAVKYTEKGSVRFTVRGGERRDGEISLHVSVADTGIGIRKEDLPKLFESFERLDEVRNRKIEGTGLGMSIVTKLLEMMGSRLKVESVYGEGSVFSFEIRQKVVNETPIGDYSWRLDESRHSVGGETLRAEGARVLVVDDNEMNLKVAKNLLKLFGITPDLAVSGFETIERLRAGNRYHIIFLDHMMPKMDGVETLKLLKSENLLPDSTPVIALTANAVNGAKEEYLAAGFDDYLSKPINVMKLEQMLVHFLPKELCSFRGEEAEKEETTTDSDDVSRLAAAGFDTEAAMRYTAGDRDFYLELVAGFAAEGERSLPLIRADWEGQDWANYQIRVHALKSTARQIGANELSELALRQELAAKERDTEAIKAGAENLLRLYEDQCLLIRKTLRLDQPPTGEDSLTGSGGNATAGDTEEIRRCLSEAKEKIHNFETEIAQDILKQLTALPAESLNAALPPTAAVPDLRGALKSILDALADFDSFSAEEQLDALLEAISKENAE